MLIAINKIKYSDYACILIVNYKNCHFNKKGIVTEMAMELTNRLNDGFRPTQLLRAL